MRKDAADVRVVLRRDGGGIVVESRDGSAYGEPQPTARGLRRWHEAGIPLYVYSSGSVRAQRLLFGHSDAGDLTPLFSDYFDTRVGHKRESASYSAIAARIGRPAGDVLFLSDVVDELDAAAAAGMRTIHVARDPEIPRGGHAVAHDFDAIIF